MKHRVKSILHIEYSANTDGVRHLIGQIRLASVLSTKVETKVNEPLGEQANTIDACRKRAKSYDSSGILGLETWRKEAVRTLNLKRGNLVVDIGCGTGLNFALLQEAIGPVG